MLINTLAALDAYPEHISVGGFDVAPIAPATIKNAHLFLTNLHQLLLNAGLTWHDPHISTEGHGEITLEWWKYEREQCLIFYIEPSGEISYIRAWGPHIYEQMEDGTNPNPSILLSLWQELWTTTQ